MDDIEALRFLRDVHEGKDGTGENLTAEQLGLVLQELPSIPKDSNPFIHDSYHMGTRLFDDLMIMHGDSQEDYMILVFRKTGRRIRIQFNAGLTGKEKKHE